MVAASGCGGSSPGTSGAPLAIGVQDDALLASGEPNAVPTTKGAHPRVLRYNVGWDAVAPTAPAHPSNPGDPAYHWASADLVLRRATSIGAAPLVTIVGSPGWANGGANPATAPKDPASFGAFCHAVARRYGGSFTPPGATAPLPRVDRFTVWNEPNRGQYLMPQGPAGHQAPVIYAGLVRACLSAIKAANPQAQVAVGPVASVGAWHGLSPLRFLERYLAAGGPAPDILAVNPYMEGQTPQYTPADYPSNGAVTVNNLDVLEKKLSDTVGHAVPVWLTELAWRTADGTPGAVTPDQQKSLFADAVDVIRRHEPYVKVLVWFLVRDESPTSYWQSGLVDTAWRHKPIYDTFRSLADDAAPGSR
jgi:hypothetical protein